MAEAARPHGGTIPIDAGWDKVPEDSAEPAGDVPSGA
jgi:hypothetical protein